MEAVVDRTYVYAPWIRDFFKEQEKSMIQYCKDHGNDCKNCMHRSCKTIHARIYQKEVN